MPMPPYPLYCYTKDCKNLAAYKIAARWSDGVRSELKTYGLCCPDCLPYWYRRALEKKGSCQQAPGETLEDPGIYQVERGVRDQQLKRLEEVEKQLT